MAIKDLADLVNVPEAQLRRVVRLMATAEFLKEPQPGSGRVAHTPLSASFVTDCSNLDAVMFLSGTAVRAALEMPEATQSQLSGFASSSPTGRLPFGTACEQQPKLRREWAAYCGCMRDSTQAVVDLLDRLDWASLGKARIVDVSQPAAKRSSRCARPLGLARVRECFGCFERSICTCCHVVSLLSEHVAERENLPGLQNMQVDAESTQVAEGLAERNADLRWVVQMADGSVTAETSLATSDGGRRGLHTRLDMQIRAPHTPQTLEDAAVYMLRGAEPDYESLASWAQAGLQSHLAVLRANPSAMLLLAVQLGPDPGSVNGAVEAVACARHMTIVQLTGGSREMDLAGLEELVGCVRDSRGGLVVVNRLRSRHCSTIALGIKYMAKPQPLAMVDPSLIWAITSP